MGHPSLFPFHRAPPSAAPRYDAPPGRPSSNDCTEASFEQPVDHFTWGPPLGGYPATFFQRYFTYDKFWRAKGGKGPIFFYVATPPPEA
mmetsp:Transcript_28107/g.89629  ORF Transcript_28107/g.89629 Transcript_28107/m.89629 type:complete len:89 (-) Transcript_28107:27-293(-)